MPAAGSWITSPGDGLHQIDHHLDQDARGEILPGPALGFLGHFLQQAFIGIAKGIALLAEPVQAIDGGDQLAQVCRRADDGGRILEDRDDRAILDLGAIAQIDQQLLVTLQHFGFARGFERGPAIVLRDAAFVLLLRTHFEEQQIGQLGDILHVGDAVLAQHRAFTPQLVHQILRGVHLVWVFLGGAVAAPDGSVEVFEHFA